MATARTGGGGAGRYDPDRKTGLLPANSTAPRAPPFGSDSGGGATYIHGSKIIRNDTKPEFLAEKLGSGREEKKKRKRDKEEEEEMLKALLGRDGGKSVGAQQLGRALEVARGQKQKKDGSKEEQNKRAVAFPLELARKMGFNPVLKPGESVSASASRGTDSHKRVGCVHLAQCLCLLSVCSTIGEDD